LKLPVNYNEISQRERKAVREEYARLQNNFCKHCGKLLSGPAPPEILEKDIQENLFPPNFFKFPVHLHHHHETGETIGVVHCHCNAVLWQYFGE
jgi:hypothetical protein